MKRKNSTKHVFELDCWTWWTKEAAKHRAARLLESKCQVWVSSGILNFWFADDLQSHKSQKSSMKESHYDIQSQHPIYNTDKEEDTRLSITMVSSTQASAIYICVDGFWLGWLFWISFTEYRLRSSGAAAATSDRCTWQIRLAPVWGAVIVK